MTSLSSEPVRFSRLKKIDISAAHYAAGFGDETDSMRKGTALHSYLLGAKDKVILYPGRRAGHAWTAFQAEHVGKTILIRSELHCVDQMRKSVEAHPLARDLLDDGVQENRITWEVGGRACAGTPDVVKPRRGRKRLVELKSCDTAKPEWFRRKAERFKYHAQLDWYANGLERCTAYEPGPVDEAYIVAVENVAPYLTQVYRVDASMLRKGRDLWQGWIEYLRECERAGRFPGYADGAVDWSDEGPDGLGLDWGAAAQ